MESVPSKADPPKRNRRWFQFSLRTLMIVVTLSCVAFGWAGNQVLIVRERAHVLNLLHNHWIFFGSSNSMPGFFASNPPPTVNWLRRILGDQPANLLVVPRQLYDEKEIMRRARRAFPEAVFRVTDEFMRG
jgi:hypothetical protein